jgi:hypothetical protein
MKVNISVTWIGVLLVITAVVILTLRGIDVIRIIFPTSEGFVGGEAMSEDLQLSGCPADSKSYVDDGGRSVCCDGKIIGGKCHGTQICSLSENFGNLPTCNAWFGAYLEEKGAKRCPSSMPNYYEDNNAGVKGCTEGYRTKDGKSPASPSSKSCKLYNDREDDMVKIDSCTNQKILEETQCFTGNVDGTRKNLVNLNHLPGGKIPPWVRCEAVDRTTMMPIGCLTDSSYARTVDYWTEKFQTNHKGWKETSSSWPPYYKLNFCSVVQKLNIDKSIDFKALDSLKMF